MVPIASGQILRSGRGGVGNYKRVETAPVGCSESSGPLQAGGIFVRDPKTPLLLSFAPKQSSAQGAAEQHAVQAHDNQAPSITTRGDGVYYRRRCEVQWDDFVAGRARGGGSRQMQHDESRYTRICPELLASQLPRFQDAQRMEELEHHVERALQREEMVGTITLAAHRLVASTFFFETEPGSVKQSPSGYTCTGWSVPTLVVPPIR
jgi:hypothetical protein